ncbi:MAG: TIM barrel protein [Armatimonadota bacterium]|nr:MAG: TIM barrel protein [Armatimonadota bacterium]
MQESIAGYCLVGIVHPMVYPEVVKGDGGALESLSRIAADPFFSAVEVTRMKGAKVRAEAARMLATAGMDVIFAGQPVLLGEGLSLCELDEGKRGKAVEACKEMIEEAYELGASILVVVSGPDPGESARRRATEVLTDSLKQLCAYSQEKTEERMLAISLENFDRDVDKRCLIGPTKEGAAIADAIRGEYSNFGLTIDVSHQPLLRESVDEMVLAAVDHLVHVHVGNCVVSDSSHPAYGDQHPRFGLPGGAIGVEELKRFLEALIYGGYFKRNTPTTMPVVSFEVRPREGESPELVIANAKRALTQAWARL